MTAIATLDELLAHAEELEQEAMERYEQLADEMSVHNQPELAELFEKMARIEGLHRDKVRDLAADRELPRLAPWAYRWPTPESPESVPVGQERYRMSARQALEMVLACEERAEAFFADAAASCPDPVARGLAAELAGEEREHAEIIRAWLARYPAEAGAEPLPDLDEPAAQD